ncbi:MAG: hypothetical protein Q9163_002070 [Psora crenata]
MSWWSGGSGRYSPFTSFYSRSGPPAVTEDDYSYLTGEDDHQGRSLRDDSYGLSSSSANNTTSTHHYGGHPETADLGPDILRLRHKGKIYPLEFEAFSIAEGQLKVRDVRRRAAQELGVDDPCRVKLLYKREEMRDDKESCKHENLKQNSEVVCIVSAEALPSSRGGGDDSGGYGSSDSAEGSSVANGVDSPRVEVDGTLVEGRRKKRKGHRGGRKKRDRDPDVDAGAGSVSGGGASRDFLAPPTNGSGTTGFRSKSSSPPPTTSRSKKPSSSSTDPLDQILDHFNTTLLPPVQAFLASPPPLGSKERGNEYKKLTEAILQQVLKLDSIEINGDEGLRGRRKDMVQKAQRILAELDRVGKR